MKCKAVVLIVTLLVTLGCQPVSTAFRPPNRNELEDFTRERRITPIDDKLLDDSTLLLYENGTSFGYYTLTVRSPEGVRVLSNVSAAKSDQPILIIDQFTGDRPFVAVVIQDAALSAETAAIQVAIDSQNYLGATTDGRAGAILVSPWRVNGWKTLTLYNSQGQVLYSQGVYPLQQLRVVNGGREDIKGLKVLFPGPTADASATRVEFGDIPAGETTEYRNVPSGVYRYAAYEYTLDSRVVNQAVMDWVGESPMQGEKFTYRIALDTKKEPGTQIELVEVLVEKP